MKKVLIVEDDPDIAELLSIHLRDLELQVSKARDGQAGLHMSRENTYDLIILDIMLPKIDGVELCRRLRAEKLYAPILMLTAKSEEIDKVLGLETGADDYMTKPFSIREFISRSKALLRRSDMAAKKHDPQDQTDVCINHLNIDAQKRKVIINGTTINLTPKEFDLLWLLATHPGRSYSREELLNKVWGYEFNGYEHTVNSHINRLRSKIEKDVNQPEFILTTWGIGYRFNDEI